MNWKKTTHQLPNNKEEVIIKCSDGFHIAVFSEGQSGFTISRGGTIVTSGNVELWATLEKPEIKNTNHH